MSITCVYNTVYAWTLLIGQSDQKGIRPVKRTGCWFVGGDDLTGTVHIF